MTIETRSDKSASLPPTYLIGSALILLLILVLLFCAIKSPANPYDEGLVLVGATRIAAGEVPYRDFWTNYSPGQFYALALLFRVFGTNVIVERIYDRLVIIALVIATYFLELTMIPRKRALIVAPIVGVFLSSTGFFGYPVFAALFSGVVGLKCLLMFTTSERRSWLFLAGIFVGITTLFRHDFGAYAGFAIVATLFVYAVCERARREGQIISTALLEVLLVTVGGMVVVFPVLLYLVMSGALGQLWSDLFVYTITVFPHVRHIPLPGIIPVLTRHGVFAWLTFYGCVSALSASLIVGIDVVRGVLKERAALGAQQVGLIGSALFGLLLLIQAINRFDWVHLLPSFFFAVIAGASVLCNPPSRLARLLRVRMFVAVSLNAVVLPAVLRLSLGTGVWAPWRCYSHVRRAACIAVAPDEERAIGYVSAHTRKDEYIFVGNPRHDVVFINDVLFYFLAERPIPVAYHEMDAGQVTTLPVQQTIVHDLEARDVRNIVLVEGLISREPTDSSISSGIHFLDNFIRGAYAQVAQFGSYEIWQKRSDSFGVLGLQGVVLEARK